MTPSSRSAKYRLSKKASTAARLSGLMLVQLCARLVSTSRLAPSDLVPSITASTSARPTSQVPRILKTSRIHNFLCARDIVSGVPYGPCRRSLCHGLGLAHKMAAGLCKTIHVLRR